MDRGFLAKIAREVVNGYGVKRTDRFHLKYKKFDHAGQKLIAIEQNPRTGSKWGKLAEAGHNVVQFKEVSTDTYKAVCVDGNVILF